MPIKAKAHFYVTGYDRKGREKQVPVHVKRSIRKDKEYV